MCRCRLRSPYRLPLGQRRQRAKPRRRSAWGRRPPSPSSRARSCARPQRFARARVDIQAYDPCWLHSGIGDTLQKEASNRGVAVRDLLFSRPGFQLGGQAVTCRVAAGGLPRMKPRSFFQLAASTQLASLRPQRGAEQKQGSDRTPTMAHAISLGEFKPSRHFCGLGDDATGTAGVPLSAL